MASRTERLDVRLTPQHKRLIEQAALHTGQPVTTFVLASALDSARETLERGSRTVLSTRDWAEFLRILESDDAPAPALVRAARRSRRRDG